MLLLRPVSGYALAPTVLPTLVSASQGPGVAPGSASPLLQAIAAAIIVGLAVVVLLGLARYVIGRGPLPDK